MRPAEQEVLREARRVLRRLAAPRAALFARGTQFLVGRPSSRVGVAAEIVQEFSRMGWILPDGPGRYVMAQAGLDFLARQSADGFGAQHREMGGGRSRAARRWRSTRPSRRWPGCGTGA
jgi:hypothetical protein